MAHDHSTSAIGALAPVGSTSSTDTNLSAGSTGAQNRRPQRNLNATHLLGIPPSAKTVRKLTKELIQVAKQPGSEARITELMDRGADPNIAPNWMLRGRSTPLVTAAKARQEGNVRAMLSHWSGIVNRHLLNPSDHMTASDTARNCEAYEVRDLLTYFPPTRSESLAPAGLYPQRESAGRRERQAMNKAAVTRLQTELNKIAPCTASTKVLTDVRTQVTQAWDQRDPSKPTVVLISGTPGTRIGMATQLGALTGIQAIDMAAAGQAPIGKRHFLVDVNDDAVQRDRDWTNKTATFLQGDDLSSRTAPIDTLNLLGSKGVDAARSAYAMMTSVAQSAGYEVRSMDRLELDAPARDSAGFRPVKGVRNFATLRERDQFICDDLRDTVESAHPGDVMIVIASPGRMKMLDESLKMGDQANVIGIANLPDTPGTDADVREDARYVVSQPGIMKIRASESAEGQGMDVLAAAKSLGLPQGGRTAVTPAANIQTRMTIAA